MIKNTVIGSTAHVPLLQILFAKYLIKFFKIAFSMEKLASKEKHLLRKIEIGRCFQPARLSFANKRKPTKAQVNRCRSAEGTKTSHESSEGMASVGVCVEPKVGFLG